MLQTKRRASTERADEIYDVIARTSRHELTVPNRRPR